MDTQRISLTAHCIVNYKDRVFVIGGWNTRDSVFELRDCGLIPMRFKLPRDYRVHRTDINHFNTNISITNIIFHNILISKNSCAVHEDRIWVCGSRDAPYACDSYDENWEHRQEKNTIHAHSYGSMVSAPDRGLTIIGKKYKQTKVDGPVGPNRTGHRHFLSFSNEILTIYFKVV